MKNMSKGTKFFLGTNPKLEVRDTGKYGKGVFTKEDIKKGEKVHIMSGKKVSLDELVKRIKKGREKIDDPLQIGKKIYIDLNYLSHAFNHSCKPNVGLRKKSEMFAIRNIKKGEEVTYDYSATIAPTEWKMKCKCGSRKCRKILGDVFSIGSKQLKKYKKAGALQTYIKNILKTVKRDKNGNIELPKYEINAIQQLARK